MGSMGRPLSLRSSASLSSGAKWPTLCRIFCMPMNFAAAKRWEPPTPMSIGNPLFEAGTPIAHELLKWDPPKSRAPLVRSTSPWDTDTQTLGQDTMLCSSLVQMSDPFSVPALNMCTVTAAPKTHMSLCATSLVWSATSTRPDNANATATATVDRGREYPRASFIAPLQSPYLQLGLSDQAYTP
jgi:hypothetical protein